MCRRCWPWGQGGLLLDVSLHPRFTENRFVHLTYAASTLEASHTRLARARFYGRGLQNLEVIYALPQRKRDSQHYGSRLLWLPDTTLLLPIGDGGNTPLQLEGELIRRQAQNHGSALGKILRLNAGGTPTVGNPFRPDARALPGLWSPGHRKIQGLAYDPLRQRVWATEHLARGGDELNRIEAGANYGWPPPAAGCWGRRGSPSASACGICTRARTACSTCSPMAAAMAS